MPAIFLHASGQFCVKLRGRHVYLGTSRDKAEALVRDLTHTKETTPTLGVAIQRFLDTRSELSEYTLRDYRRVLGYLSPMLRTPFENVSEGHLEDIGRRCTKGQNGRKLAPRSVALQLQYTRTFLTWCVDQGWLDSTLVRRAFRGSLSKPNATQIARHDSSHLPSMPSRDDVLRLLEASRPWFRGVILLALNGGLGPTDIARAETKHLDGRWLVLPRQKTGKQRRIPLWPETLATVQSAGHLIQTPNRRRVTVKPSKSRLGEEYARTRERAGVDCGGLYMLRSLFCCIADGAGDPVATSYLMGHAARSTTDRYRKWIADERLDAVTGCVRAWLWPESS